MAYSKRSLTSCSDSGLLGSNNADWEHDRRSAILTVAEVNRAAAFCGTDLNIELRPSGHLLKDVASSMALSTCITSARVLHYAMLVQKGSAEHTSWERTAKSKPTATDEVTLAWPRCMIKAAAPALCVLAMVFFDAPAEAVIFYIPSVRKDMIALAHGPAIGKEHHLIV